jgi:hypothetical protein
MLRNLLLATLFMWAAKGIIRAQCVPPEWFPKTEIFSAIADIQGQGPAGSELHLEEQGKRAAATLRDYRGKAIPVVTKLQGSIEESKPVGGGPATCKVRLSGKENRGPVEVEGEITPVYQSSAKSLGVDAGDGQRDDVNTRCLQDISKIEY